MSTELTDAECDAIRAEVFPRSVTTDEMRAHSRRLIRAGFAAASARAPQGEALTDAECERIARDAWRTATKHMGGVAVLPGWTMVALCRAALDGFAAASARAPSVGREPVDKVPPELWYAGEALAKIDDVLCDYWCARSVRESADVNADAAPSATPSEPQACTCGGPSDGFHDLSCPLAVPPAQGQEDGLVQRLHDFPRDLASASLRETLLFERCIEAADRIEADAKRIAELKHGSDNACRHAAEHAQWQLEAEAARDEASNALRTLLATNVLTREEDRKMCRTALRDAKASDKEQT